MHQPVKKTLQQWPLKERPERVAHDTPWQAAQQRQLRGAKKQKRRNNHGQQQMLHHVSGQQERGKGVQRRSKRHVNRSQPGEKGYQSRERISRRNLTAKLSPATEIDQRRRQQAKGGHGQKSPGGQGCGFHVHGNLHYRRNADVQGNRSSQKRRLNLRRAFGALRPPLALAGRQGRWNRAQAAGPSGAKTPCN